ncbi:uncharacterized protein LOC130929305 [Corythoichthys intestinalis]|uniref:uncharacterized protein LOC130929305 n=1 Tax=Corythoichthys intestinalis TaxID=161448 RepID=UPI0025A50C44|nr:uncharacterized protein LOC130929305 [Corythoichthys intestinalis]
MKTNRLLLLLTAVICSQLAQTDAVIPSTPISSADGSTQFCFTDGTMTECINISGDNEDTVQTEFGVVDSDLEGLVNAKLPQIEGSGTCVLTCDLLSSGNLTQVKAIEVKEVNFTKTDVEETKYIDLSGCRSQGEILLPGSDRQSTSGDCTIISCTNQGQLINETTCGSTETCVANICEPTYRVCTVTSGQVIQFFGQVSSVRDRCLYSLLEPDDGSFKLLAAFEDRRSHILTFLDHLDLVLLNDTITLESSGRVRLNGDIQNVSTEVNGVLLSKDQTGVTLVISNSDVSIFFDGSTAHVKVPGGAALQGLCGNANDPASSPTPVSDSRSSQGCEIMPRADNLTVNSVVGQQRCSLLNSAEFAACHNKVPVEPHIDACNLTLSAYPMVDNLKCQFFEAYAQVCKMQYDIDVEDWRSSFGCQKDNNMAYCHNHECNANEFCGDSKFKKHACLCRAIFASEYNLKKTLGDPPTCREGAGTVSLIGCLLEEKGIDYKLLHLNNETCKGERDSDTHLVTFTFDSLDNCGTETEGNNTLRNSIMTGNNNRNRLITRSNVHLDITCKYNKPEVKTLLLQVKATSVARQLLSKTMNYSLVMQAYTDSDRQLPIQPNAQLDLNQLIWIELSLDEMTEDELKLVTETCWVTEQPAPNDTTRYDLIIDGCPNPEDGTVETHNNGLGKSNYFSFQMFQFLNSTSFYLHCDVDLCYKSQCEPTCNGNPNRRRRALKKKKFGDLQEGLISLEWLN